MSKNVAIITGGTNSEREVSLRSAQSTYKAVLANGHTATIYDFPADTHAFIQSYQNIDFVYIMMHGAGGEDGQIASFLDILGLQYQCTSADVLHLTMNKRRTKQVRRQHAIPVADDQLVDLQTQTPIFTASCVIKALDQGSSVGVWIVHDQEAFDSAIQQAKPYRHILIEQFLLGSECTVPILQMADGTATALPVIQIVPPAGHTFDYTNKYNNLTQEVCPAPYDQTITTQIQQTALAAYHAVGCTCYGRVDIILTQDGPVCLEINTIPGFTDASLFAKSASVYGMSFDQLVQHLMDIHLDMHI